MAKSFYITRKLRGERGQAVGEWYGVIYHGKKKLYNWLRYNWAEESIIKDLRKKKKMLPIGLLRYVAINYHYRGKGFGNTAMKEFLAWAEKKKCRYVILEADADRSQKKGFDLVNWYERWGFNVIGTCYEGRHCVMLKKMQETLT